MLLLYRLCNSNHAFFLMLKNPLINQSKKLNILQQIFQNKVNDLTLALFKITTKKNRESILPTIANTFIEQYNTYRGIKFAHVSTPFKLSSNLQSTFKAIIQIMTQCKQVKLTEHIDQSLLGGYILRVNDKH